MTELLKTQGIRKHFGSFVAIDGVDLTLPGGRLTAIIGPNGAGKTTLINLATGALAPDSGAIYFKGEAITHLATHQRVRKGLSRSFQIMNIFPHLSVLQNVLLPILSRRGRTLVPFSRLEREHEAVTEAERILSEIGLGGARDAPAGALSHGDQRLLELGIAIAPSPVLCFLDEPSAGLTPVERATVMELARRLSQRGTTTFVIVEHDMDVVFSLAEWIVVMNRGQLLAEGPPAEIRGNREVREVYLGEEF
ncbi:MAG TPA: ABC transporter ATP-binding protein [Methylomirabilota bacterium]|nr:ABC transporter ATP-binding protein [Methylomirabilota bacterium]